MSDLTPIRNYISVQEAYQLRALLEAEGIETFIANESSSAMLPHVGHAINVRLLVPAAQAKAAAELVSDAERAAKADQGPPWYCKPCQQVVDGGFEICWSCGRDRVEVEDPDGVPVTLAASDESRPSESEPTGPTHPWDEDNPYAAGGLSASRLGDPPGLTGNHEQVAAQLKQARRAAIFAIAFLPIVLNLYSIVLLLTLPEPVSNRDYVHRAARWIWALNIITMIAWSAFLTIIWR